MRLGIGIGIPQSFRRLMGTASPSITVTNTNITEGSVDGTAIGTLSVSNGTGTYTFTLTDDASGRFKVAGTNGVNLQASSIVTDYESATFHSITVHADNGAGSVLDRTYTINVTNVFDVALTTLILDDANFLDNDPAGTVIGNILGKSAGSSLSISPADSRFALSGTQLLVGLTPSSVGSINVGIVETHADAAASPKTTTLAVSCQDHLGGLPTASEIPWTPAMLGPRVWYSATDPTSFRKADGSQCAATDDCFVWRNQATTQFSRTTNIRELALTGITGTFTATETLNFSNAAVGVSLGGVAAGDILQCTQSSGTISAATTVTGATSGATATVSTVTSSVPLHAKAAGAANAFTKTGTTSPGVFGRATKDAPLGQKGLSSNARSAARLVSPTGAVSINGATGAYIFVYGRIRPPGAAAARMVLGNSKGNFQQLVQLSSTVAGQLVAADTVVPLGSPDTTEHFFGTSLRNVSATTITGNYNGAEAASAASSTTSYTNQRVSLFNTISNSTAADMEMFEYIFVESDITRADEQRMEGWAAHTYQGAGASNSLDAGHPYKNSPPTVPTGTTTVVGRVEVQILPLLDLTPWLGHGVEVMLDSYKGGGTGSLANDAVTDLWGLAYTPDQTQLDAIKADIFPGGQLGVRYVRLAMGFLYRGNRGVDGTSGLQNRIGYPSSGRYGSSTGGNGRTFNAAAKYLFSNISDVTSLTDKNTGGGLSVAYWSVPAHFKTTQSYEYGHLSWEVRRRNCTMSSGSPGKVNLTAHGYIAGDSVCFTQEAGSSIPVAIISTSGVYYVKNPTTNDFEIAATQGGASINFATSSTGSPTCQSGQLNLGVKTVRSAVYAARISELADAMISDLEYLHQNIAPVKIFTPFNEASNITQAIYGSNSPVDNTAQFDLWFDIIPKIRNSTILADLTAYGGGPGQNVIKLHNDSYQGQLGAGSALIVASGTLMSTGKTVLQEMWSWSDHDLPPISGRNIGSGLNTGAYTTLSNVDVAGSGADYIRTGVLSSGLGGLSMHSDEFEDFDVTIPRKWRFVNSVMAQANWMNFFNAPTFTGPLHLGKIATDGSLEGYAYFSFDQTTGVYTRQDWLYGRVKPLVTKMPWNSNIKLVEKTAAVTPNFQVLSWTKPNGKLCACIINRTDATYTATGVGIVNAKLMRGTRYSLTGGSFDTLTETDLGYINQSTIPVNMNAWTYEIWEEQ